MSPANCSFGPRTGPLQGGWNQSWDVRLSNDTRGLVKTALDANGLQVPANAGLAPYSWYLALGGRGERDDPNGGAYTVWYDTDGDAVRNIDEIGREVDSAWDGRHRVTSRTFPETDQERFAYDGSDNVTALTLVSKSVSGLANTVVSATYEPTWNHLASITDALNHTTTFAYYASGNGASLMQKATRPSLGGVSPVYTFTYNAIGLPTQSVDPAGVTTGHGYDSYGNLTSTTEGAVGGTNPQWGTTHWGSPAQWGGAALNLTTTFTPDAWGNVTAVTDPLSHVSNQTYDLDRRKILSIDPDPGTGFRTATNTVYDANGRVIEIDKGTTNASGSTFTALETTLAAFDPNGNKTKVSVLNGPSGSTPLTVTQMSYDPLNRMATKTFAAANASADVAYGYDFAGRPTSAKFSNVSGTPGVTWTYDAAGRRISEATNGRTLGFTYDAASNPATLTWPDGLSITYGFDPANRLTSVGGTPATVTAGYDGLSRLNALSRAAGASTSTIGYDNADRMNALAHVFTPTTGNQTWGFGFTPASQLATTTSTNTAWNWTAATAAAVNTVADGLNRNATVAGVTQTYDRFGNLTSDGTRTFTYDTENRLLTESGPIAMALSYDPMGRLQQSVINGTTIQFLYDDDALVGEYTATGNTPLRRYVQGVGTDNPLIWYEGGTMTAANANYLLADRQGSVVATGNSSGALTVNYTYDAYGAPNTWGTVGTVPRFRYTGQAAIPEAKLYHYKARVYDPVSGRFLQTDPVGYGPDVNWYVYVGDDPVNGSDPSGMGKPSGMGGDELGFFGVEGDNATQGDLGGSRGLGSATQPAAETRTAMVANQATNIRSTSNIVNKSNESSIEVAQISTPAPRDVDRIPRNPGAPAPSGPVRDMLACMVTRCPGEITRITSTSEAIAAHPITDPHRSNQAVDFHARNSRDAMQCAADCGGVYQIIEGTSRRTGAHQSTGPHIHVQTRPGLHHTTGPFHQEDQN